MRPVDGTPPQKASVLRLVVDATIEVAPTIVAGRVRDAGGDVGLSPAEERRQTDGERQGPDDGDGDLGARRRHEQRVAERAADGEVAVETDRAEVEDRRRADPNVDCQPRAAPDATERPPAEQLVDAAERQNDGAEQQVGDRQRDDERVGDGAQLAVREDRRDDEAVADHDRQVEADQRRHRNRKP